LCLAALFSFWAACGILCQVLCQDSSAGRLDAGRTAGKRPCCARLDVPTWQDLVGAVLPGRQGRSPLAQDRVGCNKTLSLLT